MIRVYNPCQFSRSARFGCIPATKEIHFAEAVISSQNMIADRLSILVTFDSNRVVSASTFNSPVMDLTRQGLEMNVPLLSQSRSTGSIFRRLWSLSSGIHLLPRRGRTRRVLQGILLPSGERTRCAHTKRAGVCSTGQVVFIFSAGSTRKSDRQSGCLLY